MNSAPSVLVVDNDIAIVVTGVWIVGHSPKLGKTEVHDIKVLWILHQQWLLLTTMSSVSSQVSACVTWWPSRLHFMFQTFYSVTVVKLIWISSVSVNIWCFHFTALYKEHENIGLVKRSQYRKDTFILMNGQAIIVTNTFSKAPHVSSHVWCYNQIFYT